MLKAPNLFFFTLHCITCYITCYVTFALHPYIHGLSQTDRPRSACLSRGHASSSVSQNWGEGLGYVSWACFAACFGGYALHQSKIQFLMLWWLVKKDYIRLLHYYITLHRTTSHYITLQHNTAQYITPHQNT